MADLNEDQKQQLDNIRTMITDMATYVTEDVGRMLEPLAALEAENAELREKLASAERLAGQSDDFLWGVALSQVEAFWQAAEKRDDVDAQQWIQYRLEPIWEQKDWYAQDGVATYSGADIRTMLVERRFRADAIHIDDAKMYKMPRSPGGGISGVNWGNAYYYKAIAHYIGVESVAITNLGTIIGIEERVRTAGAAGVVARFIRPYRSDPGDVLPREWNNAIIWPDAAGYTEIRF